MLVGLGGMHLGCWGATPGTPGHALQLAVHPEHTIGKRVANSCLGVENGVLESVLIDSLAKIACRKVLSELLYLALVLSYSTSLFYN